MTKQDRAKMWCPTLLNRRAIRYMAKSMAMFSPVEAQEQNWILGHLVTFAAREVTRAVRAERQAQRDTEELWASKRRRAEEQIVERAKGLGRKRP